MKKIKVLLCVLVLGVAGSVMALPPEIRFDMLKTRMAGELEAQEWSQVLVSLKEMRELELQLPDSMDFFEGQALFESGKQAEAYPVLERYVTAVGNERPFYSEALGYLVKAEVAMKAQLPWEEKLKGQGDAPVKGKEWLVSVADGGLSFMPIAVDSFQMGSNSEGWDEKPVHRVTLSKPFWISSTEVMQKQYREIMGTNPSHFKGDSHPVEMVSWNDAVEFCEKLTKRE